MSLAKDVSAAFVLATEHNRMLWPATHIEAQAAIAKMVQQIGIICDQYGYDPVEWLSDHAAQPDATEDSPPPRVNYVPTLDEVTRFMRLNPSTSHDVLYELSRGTPVDGEVNGK